MPLLIRSLFYPLWVLKDKSPRLRHMKLIEKSQYLDFSILRDRQFSSIKKILQHAREQSKYYGKQFREYGIRPEDIKDENDFRKVPILTKDIIRDNFRELLADNYKNEYLIPYKTGGSTGVPMTVYKDFRTAEQGVGTGLAIFKWTGWNLGEPWGRIWGNPPERTTLKEKLKNILISPEIYLDTMNLTDETMGAFVKLWRKVKPTVIHGHSHSIYIFAQYCKSRQINDIRPKGIISTSMMLMPIERKVIESVFGCKVTNLYGCEEVGLIACDCEVHQGMHLMMENVYVELINHEGNPAKAGERGAVIATSLINKAMPLIRYKIGDIAVPSEKDCPCGRCFPLIEELSGRVADFFVRKDGSLVAGVSLVERTLTSFPGISQMQMIQEDLDNIIIKIVKGDYYSSETEEKIVKELKNSVGNHNKIDLQYVDRIKPEKSGKYRFALSKVKNPYL